MFPAGSRQRYCLVEFELLSCFGRDLRADGETSFMLDTYASTHVCSWKENN